MGMACVEGMTECGREGLLFSDLGPRKVVADLTGGLLSSDGGVLLLRQIDRGLGLTRHLAGCFRDTRNALFVDHSVEQLLAQRLYGLALGYEDRVMEIPTPRWTAYDAKRFGVKPLPGTRMTIVERACTSPVWYTL